LARSVKALRGERFVGHGGLLCLVERQKVASHAIPKADPGTIMSHPRASRCELDHTPGLETAGCHAWVPARQRLVEQASMGRTSFFPALPNPQGRAGSR